MNRIQPQFFILAALVAWTAGCVNHAPKGRAQTVSFPDVKLEKYEYVQRIEIAITNGSVVAVNRLLDDWSTAVNWDNPGLKFVDLEAGHFSSGLANIHELDGFITITTDDPYFGIKATLFTESTDPTGRAPRRVEIKRSELLFRPRLPK